MIGNQLADGSIKRNDGSEITITNASAPLGLNQTAPGGFVGLAYAVEVRTPLAEGALAGASEMVVTDYP